MFDIGWTEMAIIAVIALLVVGPKDLPKVLRTVRGWIGKARSLAREFQSGVDDIVREAELKELKDEVVEATQGELAGEFDDFTDPIGDFMDDPEAVADESEAAADEPKIQPPAEGAAKKKKPSAVKTRAAKSGRERTLDGLRKVPDQPADSEPEAPEASETEDPKSRAGGTATAGNQ